jgi:sulfatase maturation enzyme AslB (radical SAM superfamily)
MDIVAVDSSTRGWSNEETISIEVTTHCNSNCLHCFARADMSGYSSLSIDLVKEVIAEGYAVGFRHLHITGGEPLLWGGLFEVLDYSFGIGYQSVFINTNGTLLTKNIAQKIAAYKNCSISVSLDGDQELHNRLRGDGSYIRAVSGIETVLDAGIELVVFTIARKSLLAALPHFTEDLYRRFPDIACLILIQLFSLTDDAFALSEEFLEPDDFVKLVQTVSLLNLYGHAIIVKNNPLTNVVSKLIEMPWLPLTPPLYRSGNIIVMANRQISVSHSCRKGLARYRPGVIRQVLASKAYQTAVAPDETTCPTCQYKNLCRENSMLRPSEYYRDLYPDVPYCRRVLQRVAPKITIEEHLTKGEMMNL